MGQAPPFFFSKFRMLIAQRYVHMNYQFSGITCLFACVKFFLHADVKDGFIASPQSVTNHKVLSYLILIYFSLKNDLVCEKRVLAFPFYETSIQPSPPPPGHLLTQPLHTIPPPALNILLYLPHLWAFLLVVILYFAVNFNSILWNILSRPCQWLKELKIITKYKCMISLLTQRINFKSL